MIFLTLKTVEIINEIYTIVSIHILISVLHYSI